MAIVLFSDWRFKRNRFLGNLQDFAHLIRSHIHAFSNLFWCRILSQFLQEVALFTNQLVNSFYHVDRNTNGTSLVCNGTGDSLTNPPSRISRELESLGIVKLINGLHQAHVSFLDQIQELHPTTNIALRNRNNQTKVGFCQTLLSFQVSLFHQDGQFLLFFIGQKRNDPNFLQVHPYWVIDLSRVASKQFLIRQLWFFFFVVQDTRTWISFFIRD